MTTAKTQVVALFTLAGAALALAAGEVTVKVTDQEPPKEVDASLRKLLEPKAVQLLDGDRVSYEFWLRTEVPLKARPASAAKALDALAETTFMGVVVAGKGHRDYKDNDIPEGIYTARFGLQPSDGDHMGTSEFPYYLLLIPAAADTSPDGISTYRAMTKASGKAIPSGHPVVISLRPVDSETAETPKLTEPAAEHKAVRLKVTGKPQDGEAVPVRFELVFKGRGHT
jgi:hypothetical protein